MGTLEGQRFPGMPQLPRSGVHGYLPAKPTRGQRAPAFALHRTENLYRLPQRDRAPAAEGGLRLRHGAGSRHAARFSGSARQVAVEPLGASLLGRSQRDRPPLDIVGAATATIIYGVAADPGASS